MDIDNSLQNIRKRIEAAVARRNMRFRDEPGIRQISPDCIKIVAASKYVDANAIVDAARAGIVIFGENKIQDLKEKVEFIKRSDPEMLSKIEFQFIGRLQSNKVRDAVCYSSMIQSVDSLKLAARINEYCEKFNRKIDVLIEVKTSTEKTKSGVAPEDALDLAGGIIKLPNLNFSGIMTMSELTKDDKIIRNCFDKAHRVFRDLCAGYGPAVKYLSMGMSDDFETAIECGSNMIRLGRVLFS